MFELILSHCARSGFLAYFRRLLSSCPSFSRLPRFQSFCLLFRAAGSKTSNPLRRKRRSFDHPIHAHAQHGIAVPPRCLNSIAQTADVTHVSLMVSFQNLYLSRFLFNFFQGPIKNDSFQSEARGGVWKILKRLSIVKIQVGNIRHVLVYSSVLFWVFFYAFSYPYKRVCPSVRLSVRPSVRPSVGWSVGRSHTS